ncbi:MAG: MFS transporter [Thermoguttaceae bacterium]
MPVAPEPTDPAPPAAPYAIWRLRAYQLYTSSWFLMTFARQIETVALAVYVYAQTGDPLALGWLGLTQALPVIVLAIPAGHLADRWDRRWVLAGMVGVTTVVSLGLTVACWRDASVAWIYLLLAISAVGQALGGPSRSALLPQLIPIVNFSQAVAWNSSVFQIAFMIGAAVGGRLVGLHDGVPIALATVVACRLLSLVALAAIPRPRLQQALQSLSLESLMAGVRFVWSRKPILATITLDLFAVLVGGCTYLLPVFAQEILKAGPAAVGYLTAAEAAGAIAMSLVLAHLPPMRRAGWTMLWAVAAFGLTTIVFGLSRSLWLSFAMMFLMGAFDNISVVVRHSLVQMLTPDAMRGRVSAVNNIFIEASNHLGGLESGVTAWLFSPVISVVGGGIGTLLIVAAAARLWPQILRIGSLRDLRPEETS